MSSRCRRTATRGGVEQAFADTESVLAGSLRPETAVFGFVEAVVFIGILMLGLLYAWRKNALAWR